MGSRLAGLIKRLRKSYLFWSVMREADKKLKEANKRRKPDGSKERER